MSLVRSPLFYVGDKYKLMPQLKKLFPNHIHTFYDVFAGGGSASLNTLADDYVLNDHNIHVIHLHEYLAKQLQHPHLFFSHEENLMDDLGLSHSVDGIYPEHFNILKRKYHKTYYAHGNHDAYIRLRNLYNQHPSKMDWFYLLLVFGFNHMTRFNQHGKFNLPVGNVDWNLNTVRALKNYAHFAQKKKYQLVSKDFTDFVEQLDFEPHDFLYFDPPYRITNSEYSKDWNINDDKRLFHLLDTLNQEGIIWGMSNVLTHHGRTNHPLITWSRQYKTYSIQSNYISCFNDTVQPDTYEIYVTNLKR